MADEKPKRAPRQVKDAGQRVVLTGIELKRNEVAAALADAAGITKEKGAERDKALKALLDLLEPGSVDEKVKVWIKVGQVEAEQREEAVTKVLGPDQPGEFRSPTASSWRGRIVRKVPTQIPLDVQVADD